jgi:putative hydrolase of the HAD superfamily
MMIKALIVDFGGVIYKTQWESVNQYFSERNGFNILVGDTQDKELIRIYNESDVGKEDFRKFFIRLKPDLEDVDSAVKNYKEGYAKFKVLNKKLLKIIRDLNKKGVRLFGFSDIKKEHYDANVKTGIYEGFEDIFTSFKFGYLKSDAKAFELLTEALKKYELAPEECLFIDDNLENIKRAEEKGYNVLHYENFPETGRVNEELKRFF